MKTLSFLNHKCVISKLCKHPSRQLSLFYPSDSPFDKFSTSTKFLHDTSACSCKSCFSRGLQIRNISRSAVNLSAPTTEIPAPEVDEKTVGIEDLLVRNKKWVARMKENDSSFFEKLARGQQPKFLYFGCSDSRVPANEILGLGAGEVFVHRNVGNLVPGNDLNSLSVLEFAVEHLKVTDIIVTGHYDCGAIKAATSRQDLGIR